MQPACSFTAGPPRAHVAVFVLITISAVVSNVQGFLPPGEPGSWSSQLLQPGPRSLQIHSSTHPLRAALHPRPKYENAEVMLRVLIQAMVQATRSKETPRRRRTFSGQKHRRTHIFSPWRGKRGGELSEGGVDGNNQKRVFSSFALTRPELVARPATYCDNCGTGQDSWNRGSGAEGGKDGESGPAPPMPFSKGPRVIPRVRYPALDDELPSFWTPGYLKVNPILHRFSKRSAETPNLPPGKRLTADLKLRAETERPEEDVSAGGRWSSASAGAYRQHQPSPRARHRSENGAASGAEGSLLSRSAEWRDSVLPVNRLGQIRSDRTHRVGSFPALVVGHKASGKLTGGNNRNGKPAHQANSRHQHHNNHDSSSGGASHFPKDKVHDIINAADRENFPDSHGFKDKTVQEPGRADANGHHEHVRDTISNSTDNNEATERQRYHVTAKQRPSHATSEETAERNGINDHTNSNTKTVWAHNDITEWQSIPSSEDFHYTPSEWAGAHHDFEYVSDPLSILEGMGGAGEIIPHVPVHHSNNDLTAEELARLMNDFGVSDELQHLFHSLDDHEKTILIASILNDVSSEHPYVHSVMDSPLVTVDNTQPGVGPFFWVAELSEDEHEAEDNADAAETEAHPALAGKSNGSTSLSETPQQVPEIPPTLTVIKPGVRPSEVTARLNNQTVPSASSESFFSLYLLGDLEDEEDHSPIPVPNAAGEENDKMKDPHTMEPAPRLTTASVQVADVSNDTVSRRRKLHQTGQDAAIVEPLGKTRTQSSQAGRATTSHFVVVSTDGHQHLSNSRPELQEGFSFSTPRVEPQAHPKVKTSTLVLGHEHEPASHPESKTGTPPSGLPQAHPKVKTSTLILGHEHEPASHPEFKTGTPHSGLPRAHPKIKTSTLILGHEHEPASHPESKTGTPPSGLPHSLSSYSESVTGTPSLRSLHPPNAHSKPNTDTRTLEHPSLPQYSARGEKPQTIYDSRYPSQSRSSTATFPQAMTSVLDLRLIVQRPSASSRSGEGTAISVEIAGKLPPGAGTLDVAPARSKTAGTLRKASADAAGHGIFSDCDSRTPSQRTLRTKGEHATISPKEEDPAAPRAARRGLGKTDAEVSLADQPAFTGNRYLKTSAANHLRKPAPPSAVEITLVEGERGGGYLKIKPGKPKRRQQRGTLGDDKTEDVIRFGEAVKRVNIVFAEDERDGSYLRITTGKRDMDDTDNKTDVVDNENNDTEILTDRYATHDSSSSTTTTTTNAYNNKENHDDQVRKMTLEAVLHPSKPLYSQVPYRYQAQGKSKVLPAERRP